MIEYFSISSVQDKPHSNLFRRYNLHIFHTSSDQLCICLAIVSAANDVTVQKSMLSQIGNHICSGRNDLGVSVFIQHGIAI